MSKHSRTGPQRATIGLARTRRHRPQPDGTWRWIWDGNPDLMVWHTTKSPPWKTRARRRARRKANGR